MARTYANTPVISSIQVGGVKRFIKDADVRAILDGINDSYFTAFANAVDAKNGLASKSYVDTKVEAIKIGEVVVDEAKGGEGADKNQPKTTASADTYRKIYLVAESDAEAGAYIEWLTIRSGAGTEADPYTYAWEQIGSTKVDLSGYVTDIKYDADNHKLQQKKGNGTYADVHTFGALAEKSSASGTVAAQDITGVKATFTAAGTVATEAHTGEGEGAVVTGVSFADNQTVSTEAALTKGDYTPVGSVSLTKADDGAFQVSGSVSKPDITITAGSEQFVKSLKAGEVDAAAVDTSKFNGGSAAELENGFYTAGSDAELSAGAQASFTQGAKAAFTQGAKASLTDQTKDTFAQAGLVAAMDETDTEMLVFTAAATASAVTDRGTFTANGDDSFTPNGDDSFTANTLQTLSGGKAAVIDVTKFNGGSAASISEGFFTAQKLPVVDATAAPTVTAALDEAPVFTGDKFNPSFDGEKAEDLVVTKVAYDKVTPGAATITKQDLKFTGTENQEAAVGTITVAAKDVTVQ